MSLESPELEASLGSDLDDLLDRLRAGGVAISAREYISANRLIARLSTEEPFRGATLGLCDFKAQLAPLLVKSAAEREVFDRAFDSVAPGSPRAAPAPAQRSEERQAQPARAVRFGRIEWIALLLIGLVMIGIVVVLRWPRPPTMIPAQNAAGAVPVAPPAPLNAPPALSGDHFVRLDAASAPFGGAPTLEELAGELARTAPSQIDPAAYLHDLQAATGLPRGQPLPVGIVRAALPEVLMAKVQADRAPYAELLRDPALDARLARAIEQIELPAKSIQTLEALTAEMARLTPGDVDPLGKRQPGAAWTAAAVDSGGQRSIGPAPLLAMRIARAGNLAQVDKAFGAQDPSIVARAEAVISGQQGARPWAAAASGSGGWSWRPFLAAAAPLAWLALWLARTLERRKAFLRRRPPTSPPLRTALALSASQMPRDEQTQRLMLRALQRRTSIPSDRLDIEATVRATLESGGGRLIQPCFSETRATPEYLVLVERDGPGDQEAQRLYGLARGLRDLFAVDIYFYQSEPAYVEREAGGEFRAIEELIAACPNHRLLVMGSGVGFLDPYSLAPLDSALKLMFWPQRALLTPVPVSEWAREEFALARGLRLPVGRATSEGMLALARMLGLEASESPDLLNASGDGHARPLSERLRQEPFRYLNDSPPDGEPVDDLVGTLRRYLGPAGFDWLCTLAIYPAVQWELTLFLGLQLAGDDGAPLYSEPRLAALTQLPWLRAGVMPAWLRRALIGALGQAQTEAARKALLRLLEGSRDTLRPVERLDLAHEIALSRPSPDELFNDEVFVDFLARGGIEDFAAPEPNALERLLPAAFRPRLDPQELVVAAAAAVYAAAAFWLAPPPAGGWLAAGAWTPLALVYLGALATLVAAWPVDALRAGQRAIRRIAPSSLVVTSIALVGSVPLLGLIGDATSGPGVFALSSVLAGVALTPPAIWIAARVGAPTIRRGAAWRVLAGLGLEGILAAAVGIALAKVAQGFPRPLGWEMGLTAAALGVFAAGWVSTRWQLTPPPSRSLPPGGQWRLGLPRLALAIAFLAPAALAAAWLSANDQVLQTASTSGEPVVVARSNDGGFIAIASDRMVRVVNAAAPKAVPLAEFLAPGRITALAVRGAAGRFYVAVGTYDRGVALSQGARPLVWLPTGAPIIGLAPDPGAASAFVVTLEDGRGGKLRLVAGSPVLTFFSTTSAPRRVSASSASVPPPAQTLVDNLWLCAPSTTAWDKVAATGDTAAMRKVIATMPSACVSLRLRAEAEVRQPQPSNVALAGQWHGTYAYAPSATQVAQAANDFDFDLKINGLIVSGRITEPNAFGQAGVPFLYANVQGSITGDTIRFTKTYDGTGGQTHKVDYTGTIDRANGMVTGTWLIPASATAAASTGTFTMSLTSGPAASGQ